MTPRDTRTGSVLEDMVLPALRKGGYTADIQRRVGCRPGGGTHKVDAVAQRDGREILISLKWQQVGGTAEQKVPFEIICLKEAVEDGTTPYTKAYLVLGGGGWSLRDYYVSGELKKHLDYEASVEVIKFEDFIAKANRGKL